LQIWVVPEARNITPGYEQKHFSKADRQGKLTLVASVMGLTEPSWCTKT